MSYENPVQDKVDFSFSGSELYIEPPSNEVAFDFLPKPSKSIDYKGPAPNKVDFSFTKSEAYTPPASGEVAFDFLPPASGGNSISPFGMYNRGNVGEPILLWTEFADPIGIDSSPVGKPLLVQAENKGVFSFLGTEGYVPPTYDSVRFVFGAGGAQGLILVPAIDPGSFGLHGVKQDQPITGVGGFNASAIGQLKISNKTNYLFTPGISSFRSGTAQLKNKTEQLYPAGVHASLYGKPLIFNSKQFVSVQGRDQSLYGKPLMRGGVRWINPSGLLSQAIGRPALLNTTANHYAYPTGIPSKTVFASPVITPHTIWARGIYGTQFGNVAVIPALTIKPKGLNSFTAGTATAWYRIRPLGVTGFNSYETGYPKLFDPSQTFYPSPMVRSSVFGDIYIRNNNAYIKTAGIDSLAMSEWATVYPRNKGLYARSFVSQLFGDTVIKNKSPSIFFNGLPAPVFPDHAIGYLIRRIAPTGFDHLKLGGPTVIKTPELKPNGLAATGFGLQWVSNYTRHIQNNGKDHSAAGVPIVWFRFRYVTPGSWESSRFSSAATLTHGVREVIGKGFIQQGYGNAWVSRGVRLVQPLSIYKEYPSSHFVGRHQQISPLGFIATKFGTRIIPGIQALYPLGFTGVFGLADVDLSIRHLKTKGFATGGNQEALRWGWNTVYNQTQYIVQEFAGDNGLVPPKWSDWTAIENRNKTIGAIGTLMQRFGYATIANNARTLEPLGLVATKFSQPLIAYGIRRLPLQGIEAPAMSDWFVIHNGARVIKPKGEVQTIFGDADVVTNRRYYRSVGRIESFESGTPMIAYRIRTLDIEKRYSIAPPIIRLPVIDLYTRYIEFQGYETAKYGLASLSIHFRIITPRWDHKEKFGYPALKNVTPELLTKGHDSQEYGYTKVRTQWRNIDAQGDNTALIGLHKISDTKQHIAVPGLLDGMSSQKHQVIKTASAPYSLQYIYLNDEDESSGGEGYGISFDERLLGKQVPSPGLNQNVLYHRGHQSSRFGSQFLWGNNLMIDGGIGVVSDAVPSPLVRNKDNVISLEGGGILNKIELGKPRLSPHTIYAVKEAPAQAIRNHKQQELFYVGETRQYPPGERFGRVRLESTIRSIYPYWGTPSSNYRFGTARLDLALKLVKTEGFRLGRFGIPSIPFTPQSITIRLGIFATEFGRQSVDREAYTGPRYIRPPTINSLVFGATHADNYIRNLYARGYSSQLMGRSKSNDTPFMWQGLRIGAHVPLIIGGTDTSLYGNAFISLRVRGVEVPGFDAMKSEYDITNFGGRMSVKNADKKLPVTITIRPAAINPTSATGNQDVKLGQHFIRPDGNSDQYRKGGHHA